MTHSTKHVCFVAPELVYRRKAMVSRRHKSSSPWLVTQRKSKYMLKTVFKRTLLPLNQISNGIRRESLPRRGSLVEGVESAVSLICARFPAYNGFHHSRCSRCPGRLCFSACLIPFSSEIFHYHPVCHCRIVRSTFQSHSPSLSCPIVELLVPGFI